MAGELFGGRYLSAGAGGVEWVEKYPCASDSGIACEVTSQRIDMDMQSTRLPAEPVQPNEIVLAEILPVWVDMICAHLPEKQS